MNLSTPRPIEERTGAPDWDRVRLDFPLLMREVHGKPLVYFDNANTGQKPVQVIGAVDEFYRRYNANVSRAVHALGSEATDAYEGARNTLARFLNVRPSDLVLCSGTTFAINLVAYSWALPRLKAGDVILITRMEHHANIVPWQLVAQRTGATIRVAEITPDGALDLDALRAAMTPEVKLLAVTHVSNVLGTVNPVREICREARKRGIITVVDGSQAVPHRKVDVAAIGCDFTPSPATRCAARPVPAHCGRREHLDAMPPFLGGGEMIKEVSFDGTVFNDAPHKFEAGTPNIAGFIGLGVAADPAAAWAGERGSPRSRTAGALHRRAAPRRRPAHHRRSAGEGCGGLVPDRWRACARSGHPSGSGRRGRALGPALRTPAAVVRRRGYLPRLAGLL